MNGYLLQAIAIPVWWALMLLVDGVYAYFAYPGMDRSALFAFMMPDLVMISGLSFVVSRHPNLIVKAMILGAFAYGALWCLCASIWTQGGYLSSIVMVCGTLFNIILLQEQSLFRMSRTNRVSSNLWKTAAQSAIIWTITLIVFPLGIVHAVGDWPPMPTAASLATGGIVFGLASLLGAWSGLVMSICGRGTPLPLDGPQQLVVTGPYAWVRNPMAIAGLGQGLGVAVLLQSLAVGAYVILGMVVWNTLVRPVEEAYMRTTFGAEFDAYCGRVRCWFPRRPANT